MKYETRIPIGVNEFNEFILADICIYTNNVFSMCFDIVSPICISDMDLEEVAYNYFENFDDADKYRICESLRCSPQDAPTEMAETYDIDEFIDCSLCEYEIEVEDKYWKFESISCGQCSGGFGNIKYYFNKEDCEYFMSAWEYRHLHELADDEKTELIEKIKKYDDVDIEDVFADWIEMFCI